MINEFHILIKNENGCKDVKITDEGAIRKLDALVEQDIDIAEAVADAVNDLTVGKQGIIEVEQEIVNVKDQIIKLQSVDQEGRAVLDEKLKNLEDKRDSLLL